VSHVRMRDAGHIEKTPLLCVYWPVAQLWAWRGPNRKHFFQYTFYCCVRVFRALPRNGSTCHIMLPQLSLQVLFPYPSLLIKRTKPQKSYRAHCKNASCDNLAALQTRLTLPLQSEQGVNLSFLSTDHLPKKQKTARVVVSHVL
jgi:hypothetical protein